MNISNVVNALGVNTEIKNFLSLIGGLITYGNTQKALDTLVKEKKIEARTIEQSNGEQVYYKAIKKPMGRVSFV